MDLEKFRNNLENGKILDEREFRRLAYYAKELLAEESNVQVVTTPVCICGDTHGQFYDLMELFQTGGPIPEQNYIFMGDYVDRGYHSVESMQYLLVLKVMFPGKITILRGNHESRGVTMQYGFYDEILRKYGNTNSWQLFVEIFDCLPIAALVDGHVLCLHGGLSPKIKTIDQMRVLDRFQEIPFEGPLADIMWSDPDKFVEKWEQNCRGAGWLYGQSIVESFNHINGLSLICRSHQLVNEGYQYLFKEQLVTIWSCPNYCYRMGNQASIMKMFEDQTRSFLMFTESGKSADSVPPKKVLPYFL